MMACLTCQTAKNSKWNDQLDKVKKAAIAAGKEKGLDYMVIVETINGIPGYREPGDESLARLRTIDHVVIA